MDMFASMISNIYIFAYKYEHSNEQNIVFQGLKGHSYACHNIRARTYRLSDALLCI